MKHFNGWKWLEICTRYKESTESTEDTESKGSMESTGSTETTETTETTKSSGEKKYTYFDETF